MNDQSNYVCLATNSHGTNCRLIPQSHKLQLLVKYYSDQMFFSKNRFIFYQNK